MLQLATTQTRRRKASASHVDIKRDELKAAMIAWKNCDTPEADGGLPIVNQSTASGKRAAKKYSKAFDHVTNVAAEIIEAPADSVEGLLLKIEALGVLADCTQSTHAKVWSKTPDFSRWRPELTNYYCDDAPLIALMTMRDDLNRMKKKEQR